MVHLDQERAIIQSTKRTLPETTYPLEKETDIPYQYPSNMLTHNIYIAVEEIKGDRYTGQMEQFPDKYIWGNSYEMVLCDYDSNYILTRSMKTDQKNQWQKNTRKCMEC